MKEKGYSIYYPSSLSENSFTRVYSRLTREKKVEICLSIPPLMCSIIAPFLARPADREEIFYVRNIIVSPEACVVYVKLSLFFSGREAIFPVAVARARHNSLCLDCFSLCKSCWCIFLRANISHSILSGFFLIFRRDRCKTGKECFDRKRKQNILSDFTFLIFQKIDCVIRKRNPASSEKK